MGKPYLKIEEYHQMFVKRVLHSSGMNPPYLYVMKHASKNLLTSNCPQEKKYLSLVDFLLCGLGDYINAQPY